MFILIRKISTVLLLLTDLSYFHMSSDYMLLHMELAFFEHHKLMPYSLPKRQSLGVFHIFIVSYLVIFVNKYLELSLRNIHCHRCLGFDHAPSSNFFPFSQPFSLPFQVTVQVQRLQELNAFNAKHHTNYLICGAFSRYPPENDSEPYILSSYKFVVL